MLAKLLFLLWLIVIGASLCLLMFNVREICFAAMER